MKTKRPVYILWTVLLLCLLSCAADTSQSPFSKEKRVFKLGTSRSKPTKVDRKSSHRSPPSTILLTQLNTQRPYPHTAPAKPRSTRPGQPQEKTRPGFTHLPDVSVTCSTSDFVLRVKPSFYGLGAEAEELRLGSSCKTNGILRPYGDLIFSYPLTACGAVRQLPPGYLVYKFILHYEPSPKRFPSRAQKIHVNVECRYPRNHHVHQLTVQPTWETAVMRKRLKGSSNDFKMELMDDSWSGPSKAHIYQLGKTLNFQVSAPNIPPEGKLYINSCYATPASATKSSLKYSIIDNFGCMVDSRRDPGASQFISRTEKTLRFSLQAFQFTSDPDTEVNIYCKLDVTTDGPSPTHKSCTYRENRWTSLQGDKSICDCCESQCVTSKPRRAMIKGSVSSGSLLVSDQPHTDEDDFLPISTSSVVISDGEAIISHYTDRLYSHEELLETVEEAEYDDRDQVYTDEEEEEVGVILAGMAEPELEELIFRERKEGEDPEVNFTALFEDEGSGYLEKEDDSQSQEEKGKEDVTFDQQQKEAEVLGHLVGVEQMLPLQEIVWRERENPKVSEEEEGNGRLADKDEEGDGVVTPEVRLEKKTSLESEEQTWYFLWR